MATLAKKYFDLAEQKGNRRYARFSNWLVTNEVLFTRANWFMLDSQKKGRGYVIPGNDCYQWVEERLEKDPAW